MWNQMSFGIFRQYFKTKYQIENLYNVCYKSFRWDEIGMYDIPACINYILKVTNREKLIYIGHSMGIFSNIKKNILND